MPRPTRTCPLCDNKKVNLFLNNGEWDIVRCVACKFVFLKQDISYQELESKFHWEESLSRERARRDRFWLRKAIHNFRKKISKPQPVKQFAITREFITPGGSILEIGCGDGKFLELCKNSYSVYGIDISKDQVDRAREKIGPERVYLQPSGEIELQKSFYDGILLFSLLEHEIKPIKLLNSCFHSLKANGTLIIKVPNYGGIGRKITGKRWSGFRFPDHMNYFTKGSLARLLKMVDFNKIVFPKLRNHFLNDSIWVVASKSR